jgi:hypothetical protein
MADALRLQFEWQDGRISLRSVRRVAKRAAATEPERRDQRGGPAVGIELELRDGERTLYRRQIGPMFPDSYEVQTGDPARPFARAPRTRPYAVEIIVPAAAQARQVVLTERRGDPRAKPPAELREIVHVNEALKPDADGKPGQGRL